MSELVDKLKKFNRKERYWLLRNALGETYLDGYFRGRLSAVVGFPIPKEAWWAMDFHLDWLVGALKELKCFEGMSFEERKQLFRGTQEDIDFLIAFGNTLILIEAKADTPWSNEQLDNKVFRLCQIFGEDGCLPGDVKMSFVLMSPAVLSGRLELDKEKKKKWPEWLEGKPWPVWMTAREQPETPLHMQLDWDAGDASEEFWSVVKCDSDGKKSRNGRDWKIEKGKGARTSTKN